MSNALRPALSALVDLQQEVADAAEKLGGEAQPADLLAGVVAPVVGMEAAAGDSLGREVGGMGGGMVGSCWTLSPT